MAGRGFRIASFNLENLDERGFDDRAAVLRPQLQRLRADVLCLQEINAHGSKHGPRSLSALDRLLEGTPYAGYHRAASLNRAEKRHSDKHNLVILSRFPIIRQRQVWHDLTPPPTLPLPDGGSVPAEWERPLLHVELDLSPLGGEGRRLHVLNLHLRAPRAAFLAGQKQDQQWRSVSGWAEGFYLAAVKQAGQALEARLVLEEIFDGDPDALIALCGDLNTGENTAPLRLLAGDEDDMGNPHLARRVLVATERTIPQPQRYSVIHNGQPVMLDHILVSRPLLGWYLGAEVHNEALGDELISPVLLRQSPETYHAPLVARFSAGGEEEP